MIIESGHDLALVLDTVTDRSEQLGICVISMDDDLRLIAVDELRPTSAEPDPLENLLDHVELIAEALEYYSQPARYYALAWSTTRSMGDDVAWLRALDDRLRAHPDLGRARLLGQVVHAADGTSATLPTCEFGLYRELSDLPRALVIPGPHGDHCPCVVCERERRIMGEYDYDYSERGYSDPEDELWPGTAGNPRFDPMWKRWYPQPARAFKRWTESEESTLVASHLEGMSCFDISLVLLRQPGAIASRLNKLGLSSRTVVPGEGSPSEAPDG